jgi:AcrR family transcriptional regulator
LRSGGVPQNTYVEAMTTELLQQRMLAAFRPGDAADAAPRWQQRKSAQTRLRLIEAGIDCLIESGYAGLSTAAVAERCKLSRGAMHHHFATRIELVAAVVEQVFYQRLRGFLDRYFTALRGGSRDQLVEIACEQHWHSEPSSPLRLSVTTKSGPAR